MANYSVGWALRTGFDVIASSFDVTSLQSPKEPGLVGSYLYEKEKKKFFSPGILDTYFYSSE